MAVNGGVKGWRKHRSERERERERERQRVLQTLGVVEWRIGVGNSGCGERMDWWRRRGIARCVVH